jgi:spore germination protein YaaH
MTRSVLAATLLLAAGPAAAAPIALAYWEDQSSNPSLQAEASTIGQLATDTWDVDATGAVTGTLPTGALALAEKHGIQTFATVSNYGATDFDPTIAHSILKSPGAQAKMLAGLDRVIALGHYTGINVDFEAVPPADRALYTKFATALARHLHSAGKRLVLSLPAVTADNPSDSWAGAYHLAALGAVVDLIQYMTYDENGPWGPPGPVAGIDWVEATAKFAASVVPPAKLSLGVPAYGYDWNLTKGTGVAIAWKSVPALITRTGATPIWDKAAASPHFAYAVDGDSHVVWYENAESTTRKAALATRLGLGGVSVWVLGDEDAEFWAALKAGGG